MAILPNNAADVKFAKRAFLCYHKATHHHCGKHRNMTGDYTTGKIIQGEKTAAETAFGRFLAQPVDREFLSPSPTLPPFPKNKTTIAKPVSVSGPATFKRGDKSTLNFLPCDKDGWWIDRADQPEQFPFNVSVRNVWTTARNIVLRSGSPHNYLRMAEHIVALRAGMGVDKLMVRTKSGDPPLFDRGNLDLVEAVESAGIVETDEPAEYSTVRETVTFAGARGDFLTFIPAKPGEYGLRVDCAVDFPSIIGKQRIVFDVTPDNFRIGAEARTNAPLSMYWYTRTLGKLFADTRNLGYTKENILVHGKKKYLNEPKLVFGGKSLEAVWHRATLDLLAAVALLDAGRFCGTILSYRAGHTQDVRMAALVLLGDYVAPHKTQNI